VLGVVLGGVIAERWGWQAGFGAVGVPGLLLAFVFLAVVRDDRAIALPGATGAAAGRSLRTIFSEVFRPRTLLIVCLGAGLQLVMVSATYAWLPSYFNRYYGFAPDKAGLAAGMVVLASGFGAIAWSMAADRLARRRPRARLLVPLVAAVATAGLMIPAFGAMSPGPAQLALIVAGGLTMSASIGPAAAVIVDVVHPGVRATAASVLSLTQNLFGLAAGPLMGGLLSDAYGLPFALAVAPVFCLAAAVMFAFASAGYERDLVRVRRDVGSEAAGAGPQVA
jgi:predicted MFS family arabinose efflux permease